MEAVPGQRFAAVRIVELRQIFAEILDAASRRDQLKTKLTGNSRVRLAQGAVHLRLRAAVIRKQRILAVGLVCPRLVNVYFGVWLVFPNRTVKLRDIGVVGFVFSAEVARLLQGNNVVPLSSQHFRQRDKLTFRPTVVFGNIRLFAAEEIVVMPLKTASADVEIDAVQAETGGRRRVVEICVGVL